MNGNLVEEVDCALICSTIAQYPDAEGRSWSVHIVAEKTQAVLDFVGDVASPF